MREVAVVEGSSVAHAGASPVAAEEGSNAE